MFEYVAKFLRELVVIPLAWVFSFVPKKKDIWVFGAWLGERYADNSRYLFEYVSDNHPEITAIWVSRNPAVVSRVVSEGRLALSASGFQAIRLVASAGVVFITHDILDVKSVVSSGALTLNLTHGTPFKRIGLDARSQRFGVFTSLFDRFLRHRLPSFRRPDHIIAASRIALPRFSSAFSMPEEVIHALGYPRWTPYADLESALRVRAQLMGGRSYSKLILYAPTHRKSGRGRVNVASIPGFADMVGWLRVNDALLVFRPHYALACDEEEILARLAGERLLLAGDGVISDINDALAAFDILVTDYSSLIYDFAVLGRPMVYMPYDLDSYLSEDAGLYVPYHQEVPGPVASNWSEVVTALNSVTAGAYAEQVSEFRSVHGEKFGRNVNAEIVEFTQHALE